MAGRRRCEEMGITANITIAVVRSTEGIVLLAASTNSSPGGLTAPFQFATGYGCAPDDETAILEVVYEFEEATATILGFGEATLTTEAGEYEIRQAAPPIYTGGGDGPNGLTVVVVRSGP